MKTKQTPTLKERAIFFENIFFKLFKENLSFENVYKNNLVFLNPVQLG